VEPPVGVNGTLLIGVSDDLVAGLAGQVGQPGVVYRSSGRQVVSPGRWAGDDGVQKTLPCAPCWAPVGAVIKTVTNLFWRPLSDYLIDGGGDRRRGRTSVVNQQACGRWQYGRGRRRRGTGGRPITCGGACSLVTGEQWWFRHSDPAITQLLMELVTRLNVVIWTVGWRAGITGGVLIIIIGQLVSMLCVARAGGDCCLRIGGGCFRWLWLAACSPWRDYWRWSAGDRMVGDVGIVQT